MAFGQPTVDFNYFLARKYALLQQNADDETTNAGSQRIQANSNAEVGTTVAQQNRVQTGLMPAESLARNALAAGQARLANVNADILPAESTARIGQLESETGLNTVQRLGFQRANLTDPKTGLPLAVAPAGGYAGQTGVTLGGSLGGVFGRSGYRGFRLGG